MYKGLEVTDAHQWYLTFQILAVYQQTIFIVPNFIEKAITVQVSQKTPMGQNRLNIAP